MVTQGRRPGGLHWWQELRRSTYDVAAEVVWRSGWTLDHGRRCMRLFWSSMVGQLIMVVGVWDFFGHQCGSKSRLLSTLTTRCVNAPALRKRRHTWSSMTSWRNQNWLTFLHYVIYTRCHQNRREATTEPGQRQHPGGDYLLISPSGVFYHYCTRIWNVGSCSPPHFDV